MKRVLPRLGETRIVGRFLFFPQALPWSDDENARIVKRWLEWAEVRQQLRRRCHKYGECFWWENVAWADIVETTVKKLEQKLIGRKDDEIC